jgi:hypothetical protein
VKQIQEYQRKWHGHVESMPPERFPPKHVFITLLKDEALDFKKYYGHENSFGLGTGHDLILESAGEEEKELIMT